MKATTKLDRLNTLRHALLDCMIESVKDTDEWHIYDDIMKRINDLMAEEHHRLGYMVVYHIVNGQTRDALFTGTKESCEIYVDILLEGHSEMKGNIIIVGAEEA